MEPAEIDRIAEEIAEANRDRRPFEPVAKDGSPVPLDAAYRIQDRVYALLASENDEAGGHKIALTSPAIQELCGVDTPVYGAFVKGKIEHTPAALSLSRFQRLGLEFEVAFEMNTDVPKDAGPCDAASIGAYVRAAMPAFELIDDRNADYSRLDAASILIDRCWCGGVVLGTPITEWREIDLSAAPARLDWNGERVDEATTGEALGHPLAGLAWVANHLIERGRTLSAGDVVMTGSAMKTRFPVAGDDVSYTIEGLGTVSATVSP